LPPGKPPEGDHSRMFTDSHLLYHSAAYFVNGKIGKVMQNERLGGHFLIYGPYNYGTKQVISFVAVLNLWRLCAKGSIDHAWFIILEGKLYHVLLCFAPNQQLH
jgi:hypothetical protein